MSAIYGLVWQKIQEPLTQGILDGLGIKGLKVDPNYINLFQNNNSTCCKRPPDTKEHFYLDIMKGDKP